MKRILTLFLSLGLLLSLAACGDGKQDIPEPTQGVTASPATRDEPFQPLTPESKPPEGDRKPGEQPPELDIPPDHKPPEGGVLPTAPQEPNVLPLPPQDGGEPPVQKPGDMQIPPGQKPLPEGQEPPTPPTLPSLTPPGNEAAVCGHTYQALASQAPSCTQAGYQNSRCSKCGATKQELLQPLGHTFTDATCTAAKTCSRCGQTQGSALGHSFSGDSCSRCGSQSIPDRTVTIFLKASGNVPVPGVTVEIYIGEDLSVPAGRTVSDGSGVVKFPLKAHTGNYKLVLAQLPAGYTAQTDTYVFRADSGSILLNAVSVIDPEDHSKAGYKVGSLMGDFTISDVDGRTYQLSGLLKSKKLVILNFWYCSCEPCKAEFPYFDQVYRKYGDQIEILAMNHFDSESDIRKIRDQMGLSFPVLREALGMQQGFGIQSYPVSVFIGSNGRILKIQKDVGFESPQELETLVKQLIG